MNEAKQELSFQKWNELRTFDKDLFVIKNLASTELESTELTSHPNGKLYIRKTIPLIIEMEEVYEVVSRIASPFLPRLVANYRYNDSIIAIWKYVEGVDLKKYVSQYGPLSPSQIKIVTSHIAQALSHLHHFGSNTIVHRDVTPSNIIIQTTNEGDLRKATLVDLSIARLWNVAKVKDTQYLGKANYAAPEQYGFMQTDNRTDIFSLGLTIGYMITGYEPGEGLEEQISHYRNNKKYSKIIEIYDTCIQFDPDNRYQSILEILEEVGYANFSPDQILINDEKTNPKIALQEKVVYMDPKKTFRERLKEKHPFLFKLSQIFAHIIFWSFYISGFINTSQGYPDASMIVATYSVFMIPWYVLFTNLFHIRDKKFFQTDTRMRLTCIYLITFFLMLITISTQN